MTSPVTRPANPGSLRVIEDVADTAAWVAYHRALESERPDALFRDPFARVLAGARGREIAERMPSLPGVHPGPRGLTWSLAVRTKVFDELILESIRGVGADAVLNLAAGLDARPYRLPLPANLVWIEADCDKILKAKTQALGDAKPACRVERVHVDLARGDARRSLFDHVATSYARVVIVTEGLLVYLDETLVGTLADELRARHEMRRWISDSAAPSIVKRQMRAWGSVLAEANAVWKFAPESGLDFFRLHGWSPVITRSCIVEARRLGREDMRYVRLLRVLSSLSGAFRRSLENAVLYSVLEPQEN